jgi:hypothetical protein
MKFPKNRANLYVVVREDYDGGGVFNVSLLGGSSELEFAEDYKDSCQQEWLDKVGHLEGAKFVTRLTTFYG